tara:strand:+ start:636 stop:1268 length:633 start_codon:yes stop_codon:yes gene_type:complete
VKKLVEIELKDINNLFSKKFWQNKHIDMLTYYCETPSLDNIFDDIYSAIEQDLSELHKAMYDSIWDSITERDRTELFQGDIKQFYFWIDGLNKISFMDYYNKLLDGFTLMEIIEQDLKKATARYEDYIDEQIETLYKRHSTNNVVTIFQTNEHLVASSTNKKNLEDTKKSLFIAGYILYHTRSKKIDNKTLYSYVYPLQDNSTLQPICLS